jgi:zinc D-Ala-D-Ala carboxypeptidase
MRRVLLFTCLVWLMASAAETALSRNALTGRFDQTTDPAFVALPEKGHMLRKEAATALAKMKKAAAAEGIQLVVISSTRNFDHQKRIWEGKWLRTQGDTPRDKARNIMLWSSMPGTSRHHWGTEVDLNELSNQWFDVGEGRKMYLWLQKNAESFGFCQPYTNKSSGRTGYNEEKWHWSYKPLAAEYLKQYNAEVKYSDINGFTSADVAPNVRAIEDYVNGISERCR